MVRWDLDIAYSTILLPVC